MTVKERENVCKMIGAKQRLIEQLEAELRAKDNQYSELNKAYAEALISYNNKVIEIIEKDKEIANLKKEYELKLDKWRSKIWNMPYYAETKMARDIVAMLFWEWKAIKEEIKNTNNNDVKWLLTRLMESKRDTFKKAYAMLKSK